MSDRSLRLEVLLQAIDRATGPIKAVTNSSKGMSAATREARDRLRELEQQNKRLENFRQVSRDVAVTGNAMQAAQGRVRDLAREIAASDRPSKAMIRNFEAAKREAGQLKDRNQNLTQQQQRLRTELTAAGVPLQGMARHQAELRGRIDDATQALRRQEAALKAQGDRMQALAKARAEYDRALQTRNRIAGAGASALAAGGGVLYAGARLAAPGMQFDEDMASVQALTRLERTSEALAELRKQARDLGASTSFTAGQVAQGQGFLAMAGFDPDAVMKAMPGMLSLSRAGRVELAQTADIASNILSGFQMTADQTGRLGDVLVGAFTRSNTNLTMLGDTMGYVAPVAAGLGMELETAAAMAGKLGDAGIQGSKAGTAMRAILSRLAAPPKMAADALEALNIQTTDAAGNLRDVPTILAEINKATRDMGSSDRAGFLRNIAGQEAFAALAYLSEQAGSGELQNLIETLGRAQGEAASNAGTMADNARGDIKAMGSAWEDVGITVFELVNGPLRMLVQTITTVVRGIGGWMQEHPRLAGAIVITIGVVAALTAGVGALMLAVAAVLGPLALAKLAITYLGIAGLVAIKPILLIVAAIAAAAAVAYLLYRSWEPIKAFFASLWDGVKQTTLDAVAWFESLPARFITIGADMMRGMADGIRNSLGAVRDSITGAGDAAIGWFKEKLGIRSPSRVFAALGDDTMAGLAVGLERSERSPLAALTRAALNLTAAAGIGLAGMAGADGGFAIDSRPPLAATTGAGTGAAAPHYEIHIHASPGMNEQTLARLVVAEIDRRDREQAARRRSRLSDED